MNIEQENAKIKEIRIISIFMLINLIYNTNPNKPTDNKNMSNTSNQTINKFYGGNPNMSSLYSTPIYAPPIYAPPIYPSQIITQSISNNLPEENFYDYYITNNIETGNNVEEKDVNLNIVLEKKIIYNDKLNNEIKKKEKEIKNNINIGNINRGDQNNLDSLRNELYILKKKSSINYILKVIQNFGIYDIVTDFYKLNNKYNINLYSIKFNEIEIYMDNMINYRIQINNVIKDIKKKMKYNNKKYYEIKELKKI